MIFFRELLAYLILIKDSKLEYFHKLLGSTKSKTNRKSILNSTSTFKINFNYKNELAKNHLKIFRKIHMKIEKRNLIFLIIQSKKSGNSFFLQKNYLNFLFILKEVTGKRSNVHDQINVFNFSTR